MPCIVWGLFFFMIEKTELRIGNLVMFDITTKCNKEFIAGEVILSDLLDTSLLLPIPLTEEWLLKFGFKDDIGETKTLIWKSYKFHITKDGFVYTDAWYKQNFIPIKYVHQLQNLYFALTGEELTYNI